MSCATTTYWKVTEDCDEDSQLAIRIYLLGSIVLISFNLVLLVFIVNRSAQGSITEVDRRHFVAPLLVVK
jgi:sn1-specific diacylglycerol lipase